MTTFMTTLMTRKATRRLAGMLTCGIVLVGCGAESVPQPESADVRDDVPAVAAGAAKLPAGRYVLDKSHSTITFKLSHLGFSFYTATFSRFDATLDLDPARPEDASLTATIDVSSLQLPAPPEGFLETLLGPEWLNAGAFPEMTFRSTKVTPTGDDTAKVTGDFTLNGKVIPVTLDVTFNGGYRGMPEFDPNARIGYSAHGTLNRSDFGIAMGIPAPGSTMGVGDRVEFMIETEFSGPPVAQAP